MRAARSAIDGSAGYLTHETLAAIYRTVQRANEFITNTKPWVLAKDEASTPLLREVLVALIASLARQASALAPFMPTKAQEL